MGDDQLLAHFDEAGVCEAGGLHDGLLGHALQPANEGEGLGWLHNVSDVRRGGQLLLRHSSCDR